VIWRRRWRWWGVFPVLFGVGVAWRAPLPDMLVASDAKTIAIRGADGLLYFVKKPQDKYITRDRLRRDGDRRDIEDAVGVPGMRCDGVGCVLPGRVLVAVSFRPEALAEDCMRAQVLVSAAQAPNCKGPAVMIDLEKAAEGEGWRITLSPMPKAESVQSYRGERPWMAE